jgi:hypothetical protein
MELKLIERESALGNGPVDSTYSVHPPQASHPTPTVDWDNVKKATEWAHKELQELDEEEKATKLGEYERLSALSRKKSKAAAQSKE